MFAVGTYEEITAQEKQIENKEIVVFLLVKPTNQAALDIIREFEYIHFNSDKYCSVYAIGYSNDFEKASDSRYSKIVSLTCYLLPDVCPHKAFLIHLHTSISVREEKS